MIYIYSYAFLLFMYTLGRLLKYEGALFWLLGVTPSVLLSILRGPVGIDTAIYFLNYERFLSGAEEFDFEPGFVLLINALSQLIASPIFIQGAISFVVALLFVLLGMKLDRKGFVFVVLLYPFFFFEFTMNAVRFGLAYCVFFLGVTYFYRNKLLSIGCLVSSFLFHITSLVFVVLTVFVNVSIRALFACIAVFLVGAFVLYDRILAKLLSYQAMESPSLFSGLAPLFLTLLFLLVVFMGFKREGVKVGDYKFIFSMIFFSVLFFCVAKLTYAGLRLQWLMLGYAISYGFYYFRDRIAIAKVDRILFFVIGFLGFFANYRYYISGAMVGDSPFLPYIFYWE